jgi:uncharacterized protein (TIGR02145 family)
MKENLNVKHYRNGDAIPEVQDSVLWVNQNEGAWCYNENNPVNGAVYGTLYNWYAANDPRNIAPVGWHLPTDDEWKTLEIYLGMSPATANLDQYRGTTEGNALKESGTTTHWTLDCCPGHDPNAGTNSSGFTALGGGFRWYFNAGDPYLSFSPPTGNAQFWTSSEQNDSTAWLRHLCVYHEDIYRANWKKANGSSIRLIKDLTTGINEGNGHLLFNVYPHPVTDILYVTVRNTEPSEIMLYDIFARQILQQTFTNSTTIKTEQLADGIYFYKLRNSDDKIESGKIIKQ